MSVLGDGNIGPYDGGDDTLIGVQNNSSAPVPAITVTGPGSFLSGFDGDGLCTFGVEGCPFGTTGYEGPGTSFVTDPLLPDSAEVDFAGAGLAANSNAYFSLEGALTSAELTARQGHLNASTVLFIQGIGSLSNCSDGSRDFVQRLSWLRSDLTSALGPSTKFLYYAYRSPYTSDPTCPDGTTPQYQQKDSCWSLDDVFSHSLVRVSQVPGGGQGTRLASYLTSYLDSHPGETLSIVSHSQGGVLASYTVKEKLSSAYASRIGAIITYDSPLLGINGGARGFLKAHSGCSGGDQRLDSSYDMDPTSAVIRQVNDSTVPSTKLYTVDADPGSSCSCGGFPLVDDAHSTTWWATAHIRVSAPSHTDIWIGCFQQSTGTICAGSDGLNLQSQGRKLVRFTSCAIGELSTDCATYADQ